MVNAFDNSTTSLTDRIRWAGFNRTNAVYTPHAVEYPWRGPNASQWARNRPAEAGNASAPKAIPLVRIGIYDGVVSYENQQPLNDPQGLSIPEDSPGRWGQLYRAGRMY